VISPHNQQAANGWEMTGLDATERELTDALLAALAQPRLACELDGQDEAVALIAARLHRRRIRLGIPALHLPRLRSLQLAAAIGCMCVATTGAAFAGVLPAPAQDALHGMLANVGVQVPATHSGRTPAAPGAPATGPQISGVAKNPATSGRSKGAAVSSQASGGHSRAGAAHGLGKAARGGSSKTARADHAHSVPTPPASAGGSDAANGQSGGHGQPGSGPASRAGSHSQPATGSGSNHAHG
jgi:hypothetical protein